MIGLDPQNVVERIRAAREPVRLPNLRQSIMVGTIGFTLVSVAMFGLWAIAGHWLTQQFGEIGFYAILGVGFMAAGGGVFQPILIGNNLGRFYALFVGSFLLYAVIWTACYLIAREMGQAQAGEWAGSIIGPALMGALFALTFRAPDQLVRCMAALVLGHSAGYFTGDLFFALESLHNRFGMLLWGLTYGAGFGAGIAASLYWCQTRVREKLTAALADADSA
ncbi:MAG TPA: hypothetical protein DCY13_18545 [Verrucomicrobiales bacterium]|nr:hypothetical protein [Verrucomicrobiales bacterium]